MSNLELRGESGLKIAIWEFSVCKLTRDNIQKLSPRALQWLVVGKMGRYQHVSLKKKWLRHRRKKTTTTAKQNRRSCAHRSQGMFQKEWSDQLRQMMLINLIR